VIDEHAPQSRSVTADGYIPQPPDGTRVGIALSGGGIRSAAFNLGALQALQEKGLLDRADYLAAVSGGNYVASALAISSAYLDDDHVASHTDGRLTAERGRPTWGRNSPEEKYLRQNTDYLAPRGAGRIWLTVSIVYGFVLNYLPFLLCAFVIGRVCGWILTLAGPPVRAGVLGGLLLPPAPVFASLVGAGGACLAAVVALVTIRRFNEDRYGSRDYARSRLEDLAARFVVAMGLTGVCLLLPALASLYGMLSRFVLSTVFSQRDPFAAGPARPLIAVLWLLASLVAAAIALALSRRLRARRLMLVLSSLAGAGLLLVPLLAALHYALDRDCWSGGDLLVVAVAVGVVLFMALFVHNRRYSMHLFYRERLNRAFALRRGTNPSGQVVAEPMPFAEPLYFSKIGQMRAAKGRERPRLIVCCSVNLTTDEVPVGRFAESFTFEHDWCGSPLFRYQRTCRYEEEYGSPGVRLTLPSIMAVSGAALSPLMGRFTYPPLRLLMALTNVRLGVWIKNPLHPSWQAGKKAPNNRLARLGVRLRDGWREPGALYVLREALGGTKSSHRFIYLTDGGHWENLGLVELLRRRCTHVLCFDASWDQAGSGLDIGRAIAMARSELGVEVDVNPDGIVAGKDGWSDDVAVRGEIRYPGDSTAILVYAKAVLTRQSNWDLRAFKSRDNRFPHHSARQQIFTDEQFEAYRHLGYKAGLRTFDLLNLPDTLLHSALPTAPVTSL